MRFYFATNTQVEQFAHRKYNSIDLSHKEQAMRPLDYVQYKTRKLWAALAGMLVVTLLLSSCGGTATKVYRVGILSGLDFFANTADSFKAKMTELGYVEGQNIIYDIQKTNVDPVAEKKILDKFVA